MDRQLQFRSLDQQPQAIDPPVRPRPPPGLLNLPQTTANAARQQRRELTHSDEMDFQYRSPADSVFSSYDRRSSSYSTDFSSTFTPQTPSTDYALSADNSSKSQNTYLDPMTTAFIPQTPTFDHQRLGHQTCEFPLPGGYQNYHQWHQANAHPIPLPTSVWGPVGTNNEKNEIEPASTNKRRCTASNRERESTPPAVTFEDDEDFLPASMLSPRPPRKHPLRRVREASMATTSSASSRGATPATSSTSSFWATPTASSDPSIWAEPSIEAMPLIFDVPTRPKAPIDPESPAQPEPLTMLEGLTRWHASLLQGPVELFEGESI